MSKVGSQTIDTFIAFLSKVGYLCCHNFLIAMSDNKDISSFIAHFSKKASFTINDIRAFYLAKDPELKDTTLRWRVYDLKNKGIITATGQGIYSLQNKPQWVPSVDNSIISINKKLEKQYNKLNFTIWSTAWLSEFTNLQAFRHLVIIAVEKDFIESAFEYLKGTGLKNLYFKPDKKELIHYLGDAKETYIITALITKSPVHPVTKLKIPKLEKILVDLFCDKDLFNSFQGSELKNIFRKAFSAYAISTSVLINYARRRAREKEMLEYITKVLSLNITIP